MTLHFSQVDDRVGKNFEELLNEAALFFLGVRRFEKMDREPTAQLTLNVFSQKLKIS